MGSLSQTHQPISRKPVVISSNMAPHPEVRDGCQEAGGGKNTERIKASGSHDHSTRTTGHRIPMENGVSRDVQPSVREDTQQGGVPQITQDNARHKGQENVRESDHPHVQRSVQQQNARDGVHGTLQTSKQSRTDHRDEQSNGRLAGTRRTQYDLTKDETSSAGPGLAGESLANGKSTLAPDPVDRSDDVVGERSAHALRRMSSFVPPDGGWGWVIVAGSFVAFFLGGGLSRSFTLIYQHMLDVFGQSDAATSATAALFGAVKMCTSPLVSMMCVKFSKRVIAVLGGLITGVAMVLTSFPLSLPYIYITYGIMAAFGVNMILTPIFIIISEYFKKRRARAMSLAMLGASFGGIGLPPLIALLFSQYDYSGAMLILAGLMFHLCLTGAVFRPVQNCQYRFIMDENQNSAQFQEAGGTNDEDDDDDDESDDDDDDDSDDDDSDDHDDDDSADHDDDNEYANDNECRLYDSQNDENNDDNDGDEDDIPGSDNDNLSWRRSSVRFERSSLSMRSNESSRNAGSSGLGKGKVSSVVTFEDESRRESEPTTYPEGLGPKYLPHYERIARLSRRRVSFQIGDLALKNPEQTSCSTTETDYGLKSFCPCLNHCMSYFGLRLLRQPRFVLYSLLMMGSILSLSVSGTFLAGLVLDLGFDETHTGIMLSASAVAAIPSRSISGIVFDLKRARPYRSLLLTSLGFLTGCFSFGMAFCAGYVELFVVYVIYSFFASAYHTHHATVLADIVRRRDVSRAMGLCRLFQGIGFIIGPISGGYLRDATGHYRNAYLFSGAVLIAFTVLYTCVEVWLLWKRKLRQKRNLPKGYVARCRADSIWSNI